MGIAKFNKTSKFSYKLEGKPNYISLKVLHEKMGESGVAKLLMFYKNTKGKFGDEFVAVVSFGGVVYNVNLPKHMNDTMSKMYNDDETVAEINEGKAGIKVYTYHSNTYNKDCYSVEFVEVDPVDDFMECDKDALPFE